MNFYERALELREETITHRRWLHSNAEVGLYMPKGQTYVMDQLRGYGFCTERIWMRCPCLKKAAKAFPVQPARRLIPAVTISMQLCY